MSLPHRGRSPSSSGVVHQKSSGYCLAATVWLVLEYFCSARNLATLISCCAGKRIQSKCQQEASSLFCKSVLRLARLFSCANLGHNEVGISQPLTEENTTVPLSPSSILLVLLPVHVKDSESDDDFAESDDDFAESNIWNKNIEHRMQTSLSNYELGKLGLSCHFALEEL